MSTVSTISLKPSARVFTPKRWVGPACPGHIFPAPSDRLGGSDHLAKPILGKTFLDRLCTELVIHIGPLKLSRQDLVTQLQLGNFAAARNIDRYCTKNKITSINQL